MCGTHVWAKETWVVAMSDQSQGELHSLVACMVGCIIELGYTYFQGSLGPQYILNTWNAFGG